MSSSSVIIHRALIKKFGHHKGLFLCCLMHFREYALYHESEKDWFKFNSEYYTDLMGWTIAEQGEMVRDLEHEKYLEWNSVHSIFKLDIEKIRAVIRCGR